MLQSNVDEALSVIIREVDTFGHFDDDNLALGISGKHLIQIHLGFTLMVGNINTKKQNISHGITP